MRPIRNDQEELYRIYSSTIVLYLFQQEQNLSQHTKEI